MTRCSTVVLFPFVLQVFGLKLGEHRGYVPFQFRLDALAFSRTKFLVLQFLCGICAGFVAANLIGRKEVYVENTVREICLVAPVQVWIGT